MRQGGADMNGTNDHEELRQYLLGILEDEVSLGRIEMRLMTDDKFADEIELAEGRLIEDYLDGELSDQDRTHFDRHFLASPERRSQLRLTENLRTLSAGEAKKTTRQKARRRSFDAFPLPTNQWLRFAAATLLVITAGLAVWRFAVYTSDADKGLAQLELAYKGQRPTESRSSVGFDYAPLVETRGGSAAVSDERARARAERYLLDASTEADDPTAHHALGLFHLAARSFDKALTEFDIARRSDPRNAAILSDIGAAYFEKARRTDYDGDTAGGMQDLALALDSVGRALDIDPTLQPALFNRALILQRMSLPGEAREAWEKYLAQDTDSAWADEARRHLETLKHQSFHPPDKSAVLNDFLAAYTRRDNDRAWKIASQTKELVTGIMLSLQLAREVSGGGDTASAKAGEAFLYLGELEKQHSGDPYFAELAQFYATAGQPRRRALLRAHERLRDAHHFILKAAFTDALAASEEAAHLFSTAGSPLEAAVADHRVAFCLTNLNRVAESNERLKKLSKFAGSGRYRWLEGFAEAWMGSNFSLLGEHSRALAHGQKSLDIASEIGDTYNALRIQNHMTVEYWQIGDAARAFATVRLSLNQPELYYLSPRQKQRNLLYATEVHFRFGYNTAAAAFGREALRVANEEVRDKWLGHAVQTRLATIHRDAAMFPQAFEAVDRSFDIANSFDDPVVRRNLNTQSRLTAASIQRRSGDCQSAAANYDAVISDFKEANFSLNMYEAYRGRVLCLIEQEQHESVEREMPDLLRIFDENRQAISAEADRNTFFDSEQDVYDIATGYAYAKRGEPDRAFEYAEASRARSLLSAIKGDPTLSVRPLGLAETRDQLPKDVQILYFAVLEDRLLTWHISASNVSTAAPQIADVQLEGMVDAYVRTVVAREDAATMAADLYELLIGPLGRELELGKPICIIADKSLLRLPFASLISPDSGKYLIEEFPLLYAPSASVFIAETELARLRDGRLTETVLSVGNPAFSRGEYPDLVDLPAAEREATAIKAIYPSTTLLTGVGADKRRIIDGMRDASVVHFAGHYVPNARFPSRSRFLLPPDDLMLEEIPPEAVRSVRLVVLSACDSGIERFFKGEGMIGAGRAFLAMGVPVVVATQWAVDSEATAELMVDFHRGRKAGPQRTMIALQRAQINILKGENTRFRAPFYWAAFMAIGGYTNY